nr:serine/arginine repetitive matrix protein 1-like [Ciona intestinalis]|eukprot:XP_009861959.1 serine/arginine repetitive matrix protein 1-like [Ciona intestinalis]
MDAGFFRGTSTDQDNRFANKQKKLLKSMKFADGLGVKVDMRKIQLDTIKPWISKRITEMLGFEDDVVIAFVYNSLEEQFPDPKVLQINLTGFLNGKNSRIFLGELWEHLASAQDNDMGIPQVFLEEKKEEIRKRQIELEEMEKLKEVEERRSRSKSKERKKEHKKKDKKKSERHYRRRSRSRSPRSRHSKSNKSPKR